MYIKRHAEKTVQKLSQMFGAVLVDGSRQAGKTTMLEKLAGGMNYATLNDPILRASAELALASQPLNAGSQLSWHPTSYICFSPISITLQRELSKRRSCTFLTRGSPHI